MDMQVENMQVENIISDKGNIVPNQFIVTSEKGRYFQSYDSIICFINKNNDIFLDSETWNYSRTTSKYRNIFLNEDTKTTKKNISSGKYILANLNKDK